MKGWLAKGRKQPYTAIGITRMPCVRCGNSALHQWQVCADNNLFRALCLACDIALNELVLVWANDPNAQEKMKQYRERSNA